MVKKKKKIIKAMIQDEDVLFFTKILVNCGRNGAVAIEMVFKIESFARDVCYGSLVVARDDKKKGRDDKKGAKTPSY